MQQVAGAGFESTDPTIISMILGQLKGLQDADHQELQGEQDTVLRSILMQMGLAPGAPSAEAGMAEGADELTVPSDPTKPVPEEEYAESQSAQQVPDEVLAALLGGGSQQMPMPMGLEGEEAMMGLSPDAYAASEASTGLEHLSDEELMALLGGAA